ncbi:MAG: DUF2281 domain-containing protein [Gammaproteobacteria bacterium]|nr:DUF2281 domain-containing protein [Gammaproteobacteria bacterium]
MHDVMRKRLWRKLEALPDDQLYQVLDFIEFLEGKYAPGQAPQPLGIQRFAERLEDRLRVRSVAPRAMSGTMKLLGTAGRMLDGLAEAGQGFVEGLKTTATPRNEAGASSPRPEPVDADGRGAAPSSGDPPARSSTGAE